MGVDRGEFHAILGPTSKKGCEELYRPLTCLHVLLTQVHFVLNPSPLLKCVKIIKKGFISSKFIRKGNMCKKMKISP